VPPRDAGHSSHSEPEVGGRDVVRREGRAGRDRRGPRDPRRRGLGRVVVLLAVILLGAFSTACEEMADSMQEPRHVLVVGIDVSGSFRNSERYSDAVEYLSYYIYGHLNELGELTRPTALFVGSVGGDTPGETKAFHPIHDFQGKDPEEIARDLDRWFPANDRLTDFNAFFDRVAERMQRQGLVLAPIDIVLVSDGVPDLQATRGNPPARPAAEEGGEEVDPYASIDLSPLEYLSRTITVRVLYPDPTVAANWERRVQRQRVRVWTTDAQVMAGWQDQLELGVPPEEQTALWNWTQDNVDFRVRARIF
ncbi:MAG: hypothetical protein ACOC8K_09565, partial [Gemmatimonadota bacterium]